MKKYVPFKYVLGMIGLFLIMPILMIILLIQIIGVYDITIAFSIFFVFLIIAGPIVFIKNEKNASIVIDKNTITNYMNDGTLNFGWTEEISKIKNVEIVKKEAARKIFKNCRAGKVILIDFGEYNLKYISVGLFTNSQINKILKKLKNK